MEPERVELIERRAEEILAQVPCYVWDGSLPVGIEDIVNDCFGLNVRVVDDMTAAPGCPELEPGQSISGLLLVSRGEIWVNADEARQWPPRKRFSIGHELGHWDLHRTGQQSLFCRSTTVDDGGPTAAKEPEPRPVTEEEANIFSAALLMPAHLIGEHYERLRGERDLFERMCDLFQASGAAMSRRLRAVIPAR